MRTEIYYFEVTVNGKKRTEMHLTWNSAAQAHQRLCELAEYTEAKHYRVTKVGTIRYTVAVDEIAIEQAEKENAA